MVLLIPLTCIKLSSTVILVHFLKNVYKNTANLFFFFAVSIIPMVCTVQANILIVRFLNYFIRNCPIRCQAFDIHVNIKTYFIINF